MFLVSIRVEYVKKLLAIKKIVYVKNNRFLTNFYLLPFLMALNINK